MKHEMEPRQKTEETKYSAYSAQLNNHKSHQQTIEKEIQLIQADIEVIKLDAYSGKWIDDRISFYLTAATFALGVIAIISSVFVFIFSQNILLSAIDGLAGVMLNITNVVLRFRNDAAKRLDSALKDIEQNENLRNLKFIIDTTDGDIRKKALEAYIDMISRSKE